MTRHHAFALFLAALGACSYAHAQFTFELSGQIAHIEDGDTMLLHPGAKRVRLAEIDAPEIDHGPGRPGQPYGQASRAALVAMSPIGSEVTAHCYEYDSQGRAVCRVLYADIDLSLEMARLGHAHAYREYVRDPRILGAQEYARNHQAGLWAWANAVYPQTWRRSCWNASAAPLFCSASESSQPVRAIAIVNPALPSIPMHPGAAPDTPGLAVLQTAIARVRAVAHWLTSIRWP